MAGFQDRQGRLYADDVPLHELAREHGTPSYVYSASLIDKTIGDLQSAFRNLLPAKQQPLIAFACKANSNLAILRLMHDKGLGTDIVSGGELFRALKAGMTPDKIVFSGVGKGDDEIRKALEAGILQINVESRPELERIAAIATDMGVKAPVAFRLNPDVDAGTHSKITTGKSENKFGMPASLIRELYELAAAHKHLHPRGLSMHIGSQLTDTGPYEEAFRVLAGFAGEIKSAGLPLEALDVGGGLGIVYKDEKPLDIDGYARLLAEIIAPLGTQIIMEPGRFLTGNAGILLTRVLYIKETENRRFLILDAGMNDLMRPALYEAWHDIIPVERNEKAPLHVYDIVGPVCETGDTFALARELPELKTGDLVAIRAGGAYGFVMASHYNTRPLPAEILVSGNKVAIVRQRDTLEDIISKETIPDWLAP